VAGDEVGLRTRTRDLCHARSTTCPVLDQRLDSLAATGLGLELLDIDRRKHIADLNVIAVLDVRSEIG
jgi:hypothetical protein